MTGGGTLTWAKRMVSLLELLARREILSFRVYTLVVVDIVLPAMQGHQYEDLRRYPLDTKGAVCCIGRTSVLFDSDWGTGH